MFCAGLLCLHHAKAKTEIKNHLCLLFMNFSQTNNRSFFCLLFFSKKSKFVCTEAVEGEGFAEKFRFDAGVILLAYR